MNELELWHQQIVRDNLEEWVMGLGFSYPAREAGWIPSIETPHQAQHDAAPVYRLRAQG